MFSSLFSSFHVNNVTEKVVDEFSGMLDLVTWNNHVDFVDDSDRTVVARKDNGWLL